MDAHTLSEEAKVMNEKFRLMTYNIGGGRRGWSSCIEDVTAVIREVSPDILVLQEVVDLQDVDGTWRSMLDQIAQIEPVGKYVYFAPTISMRNQMNVRKPLFVHALFQDVLDCRQGNSILSRYEFARLHDPIQAGMPRNVPLYLPPFYEGNRDTEPRYALLARIKQPPFPFVVGAHFTTLVGERETNASPRIVKEAFRLRAEQARCLLELLDEHVLKRREVVFLLGDFNALADEPCIAEILEGNGGFMRLRPIEGIATHSEAPGPIDHILVYPKERLVEYRCWVVDNAIARRASDHLPVAAEVSVC